MHACLMRIDSARAICGDERLHRTLPEGFRALFVAQDKPSAQAMADRCLGPYVSARGGFVFERDEPHQWLTDTDVGYSACAAETEAMRWAARRLGSIKLDCFALFYAGATFVGFWIEASEGAKSRVIASDFSDNHFEALPENFEFTSAWIAKIICDRF